MELSLPTLIGLLLGSNVLTAAITAWGSRKERSANAYAAVHSSDMTALQISNKELAAFMVLASTAEKELITLRKQMANCVCGQKGNGR
jgi:hypothetical protein